MKIDTTRQIAQMPIYSLSGVDSLLGKGLRCVLYLFFFSIYPVLRTGVDLASETLTG
ncbi:hypothetical protein [Calothrix sp. CCY 0018]|uniref:hypothetical protein n=1 Tax=Calothrix sp. CCY 0018 TaxID=3103864 RepID=UPI0039C6CDB6